MVLIFTMNNLNKLKHLSLLFSNLVLLFTIVLFFSINYVDQPGVLGEYSQNFFEVSSSLSSANNKSVLTLNSNFFFFINHYFVFNNLSMVFSLLTAALVPICILIVWDKLFTIKEFFIFSIAIFFLEFSLFSVFLTCDLVIFYISFEATLAPMLYFIGFGGSRPRKVKAMYYFFLFTFIGSFCLLLSIIIIYLELGTTNYFIVQELSKTMVLKKQYLIWFLMFLAFAVKIPLYPFHIWLPEAHVEAPTVGSILLAAVLLKLGTYGLTRYSLGLFIAGVDYFLPIVQCLGLLGVIFASLAILGQVDMKKLVAYSSIIHMSFIVLGLFSQTYSGFIGSLLLMICHGLVSSALFFYIGLLYDRYHTRNIFSYAALFQNRSAFSFFGIFFILANFGFPGTGNFVAELLILHGIFQSSFIFFLICLLGVIVAAVYSCVLLNKLLFGPKNFLLQRSILILKKKEFYISFIFFFFVVLFGLYPNCLITLLKSDVLWILEYLWKKR
jgi:NADH-quinone oxidoreductase subunit M